MTTLAALVHGGKSLSAREVEILQAYADGETAADTAARIYLSVETVKAHRKKILGKLEARSGTHAVAIAFRRGIIA